MNFQYIKIHETEDLLDRLDEEKGVIWAGGTDLMLKLKHGMLRPRKVFDISGIEELCGISFDNGLLRIGACVKLADAAGNSLVKANAPLFARFAVNIASMEVRNVGTVGGNLCASRANCGVCFLPGCRAMTGDRSVPPCRNSSYADLLLPLSACNAEAVIRSKACERRVPVRGFLKKQGSIDIKAGEVLTEIQIKCPVSGRFGLDELRYPGKMGLPYISVIARSKEDGAEVTIGGSTVRVYFFDGVRREDIDGLREKVEFTDALWLSSEYRRKVLPSVVRSAIGRAEQG